MADEQEQIILTAEQAKQLSNLVLKKKSPLVNHATEKESVVSDSDKDFHCQFLMEQIQKYAEEGKYVYHGKYNVKNPDTGKQAYSLEYFLEVAREFKHRHPSFMVIVNSGPSMRITIDWSGQHEV